MNINIDELGQQGIRQSIQKAGQAQYMQQSPLSSFALSKGAGAGAGRVQDIIAVDLGTSAFGTDAYAEKKSGLHDMAASADRSPERNARILLSNTLSGEDYERAMRDGYDPGDMSSGETVTIMDRIKAAVIKGGTEVAGFTDSIDSDRLAEITGSTVYANALENSFRENDLPMDEDIAEKAADAMKQAISLKQPDDAAVKYMVENRMDPTIMNFTLAESASSSGNASAGGFYRQDGGYLAMKADAADIEKLAPQIDAVVERAGYTAEEAGAEARWIVANDIPLTEETLDRVMDMEKVSFPVEVKTAADAVTAAIADGLAPTEGNLADPVSINRKADELMRRQDLEEARLHMSAEANMRLLRKGISIDTLPMEKLIDELKTARQEIAESLFPDDAGKITENGASAATEKYDLFETTLARVNTVRMAPAMIAGAEDRLINSGTLDEISASAARLSARYERAGQTYEAVGTQVRADLGDSIKKAFAGVDRVLDDLGLEHTEENRRAVRILSYNSIDITGRNLEQVREQDMKLRDVTERLKPGAVLSLIRDGKNPLEMTLDDLGQELDERGRDSEGSAEKYARFLYKLEKNDAITEEERKSYIGIYRLFNTMEKTDHAAIGAVLNEGARMTLGNLLSAVRSTKTAARGIDRKIDDSFGGISGGYKTPSISEQISAAFNHYSTLAHSVYENIDPLKLHELQPDNDTTLPVLAEAMEADPESAAAKELIREIDLRYAGEKAARHREELSDEDADAAAKELVETGQDVTLNRLEAMRSIRQARRGRKNMWNALDDMSAPGKGAEVLRKAFAEIGTADDEAEHFEDLYKEGVQEMAEELDEMMEDAATQLELETMILTKTQLTVAAGAADRGSYDIPVEIGGETVNLHVTLQEKEGEGSIMTASVPTAGHGVLTLSVGMNSGAMTGMLNTSASDNAAEREYLQGVRERFLSAAQTVIGTKTDASSIGLLYRVAEGREMSADGRDEMDSDVSFGLARAFVGAVAG